MALKRIHYKGSTFHIAYTIINNHASRNIAFLHGWGSNKELMILAFGKTFKDFNHIYLDLPGFGASSIDIFLDSYDYARVVEAFLKEVGVNGVLDSKLIAAHSFGGKISLLLNREIILLSSAGILLPKGFKVRSKIVISKLLSSSKILKILGFKGFSFLRAKDAQSLSPLMYEIFKHVVNEDFSSHYSSFKHSATIFWGKDDKATPLKCYHKILELMTGARATRTHIKRVDIGFKAKTKQVGRETLDNSFKDTDCEEKDAKKAQKNIGKNTESLKAHILEGDHYFFLKQADLIERLYKNANND